MFLVWFIKRAWAACGATWMWYVFLRETWLLAFFCEREAVFRIFRNAWKGQLLLRESVFIRGIGDPHITVHPNRTVSLSAFTICLAILRHVLSVIQLLTSYAVVSRHPPNKIQTNSKFITRCPTGDKSGGWLPLWRKRLFTEHPGDAWLKPDRFNDRENFTTQSIQDFSVPGGVISSCMNKNVEKRRRWHSEQGEKILEHFRCFEWRQASWKFRDSNKPEWNCGQYSEEKGHI